MTSADYLIWFDEVVAPTEPMIRLVEPGFIDWKPTERSFAIGQLISHIPQALHFNAGVLQEKKGLPSLRGILTANRHQPSATVEESVALLRDGIRVFKEAVRTLEDRQFQTKVISTPQKGDITVCRFCLFVVEHHIHHLMELHLSLKILGFPVDTRSLYTGS